MATDVLYTRLLNSRLPEEVKILLRDILDELENLLDRVDALEAAE
jgi:Mg2+ and Co2+ transporter CorA